MKRFLKAVLVVAILAAGFFAYRLLAAGYVAPKKAPPRSAVAIVSVVAAKAAEERVTVAGMGTVIPSRTLTLFPEVGGRVVFQSPRLIPGGRLEKGERLLRIDPRDYDLSLVQQDAAVTRAKLELATEQARKAVAQREWELIGQEVQPTEEGRRLALREIQLETAQAALESARSGLGKARLARGKTVIVAPMNAIVVEEAVDLGQVVAPGAKLATLVDADAFWVRVAIPVDQLAWIAAPGIGGATEGSRARVVHRAADDLEIVREGTVIRLLPDLDPRGKMARLLVEIPDPMGERIAGEGLPLLMGARVDVELFGPTLGGVIEIPRRAVRGRDEVWVKREGRLEIRKVDTAWAFGERVFLRSGVADGEEVIVSHIAAPVAGMAVALESDAAPAAAPPETPSAAPAAAKDGK